MDLQNYTFVLCVQVMWYAIPNNQFLTRFQYIGRNVENNILLILKHTLMKVGWRHIMKISAMNCNYLSADLCISVWCIKRRWLYLRQTAWNRRMTINRKQSADSTCNAN